MRSSVSGICCGRIASITLLIVAISISGCSGGSVKAGTVKGKILLNGQPLTKGTVLFFTANGGDSAGGAIQSDGTYALRNESGFQIPVGNYTVAVNVDESGLPTDPKELMEKIKKEGIPKPTETIPVKYTDSKASGLKAEIKEGANTFDFDLK